MKKKIDKDKQNKFCSQATFFIFMYHYQPQTELFSIFKSSFSLKTRQQKVI
jgi:hypothetical protein